MRHPAVLALFCLALLAGCGSPAGVLPPVTPPPAATPAEPEVPAAPAVTFDEEPSLAVSRDEPISKRAYAAFDRFNAQERRCAEHLTDPECAEMPLWTMLIADLKRRSRVDQILTVDAFFNRLKYVSDEKQFGVKDEHRTPLEFLVDAKGDCEEFAYAKYFALRRAGFPMEDIRLYVGIVPETINDKEPIGHILVSVRMDGHVFGLDVKAENEDTALILVEDEIIRLYMPHMVYNGFTFQPYTFLAYLNPTSRSHIF